MDLLARASAVPAFSAISLQRLCGGWGSQGGPCFAAAPFSTAANQGDKSGSQTSGQQQQQQQQRAAEQEVVATDQDERRRAITDKIPVRPVGVVEGTTYSLAILAALAFGVAVLWAAINELLLEPKEHKCFNLSLEKLRNDPRVTVRLGTPISGYGSESRNRAARQRVPHRITTDSEGREHIQIQFYARGPSDVGRVSADLYKDVGSKDWRFNFLFVDIDGRIPQRIMLIEPQPVTPLSPQY